MRDDEIHSDDSEEKRKYLYPTDPVIVSEGLRLEGKLLQVKGFSGKWDNYKIQRVKVGQRKLLGNEVNNVHCFLSKVDKS